jgi:hypothetical protein
MQIFNNRSVKVVSRKSTGLENMQIPTYLQNLQVIQSNVDLLQDNRTVHAQHRVKKSYSFYFVKYKTNRKTYKLNSSGHLPITSIYI